MNAGTLNTCVYIYRKPHIIGYLYNLFLCMIFSFFFIIIDHFFLFFWNFFNLTLCPISLPVPVFTATVYIVFIFYSFLSKQISRIFDCL